MVSFGLWGGRWSSLFIPVECRLSHSVLDQLKVWYGVVCLVLTVCFIPVEWCICHSCYRYVVIYECVIIHLFIFISFSCLQNLKLQNGTTLLWCDLFRGLASDQLQDAPLAGDQPFALTMAGRKTMVKIPWCRERHRRTSAPSVPKQNRSRDLPHG